MKDQVRETRVRRWAKRLGHRLSRTRADVPGRYRLTDEGDGVVVGERYDADLDAIERHLRQAAARLRQSG